MGELLTSNNDGPFELCFKYKLPNEFNLENLSKQNLKDFQRFLDKVSKMTVSQVDALYKRPTDRNDKFIHGEQIYHYEITKKFRIHVVMEGGIFKIVRIDPNHDVHS